MKTDIIDAKHEELFHDEWANNINIEKILVKESFECSTSIENKYALKKMGSIKNKKILDLGCGAGEASVYFATKGASVVALDLSSKMLETVRKLSLRHQQKVNTIKGSTDNLPFPDESFDWVYGNAILHHVDINIAVSEVHRVLKKNGKAIFIEPIHYNPAINLYRKMAMGVRTEDEHPLKINDLRIMKKWFSKITHKEFWLCTLLLFVHFFVIERIHPAKERYWKKIIYDEKKYRFFFKILHAIDNVILAIFFPARFWCWNTVILLEQKNEIHRID